MSLLELVPEELRSAAKRDQFISWLNGTGWKRHTKKYVLLDWTEFTGVEMTRQLAEAVGVSGQI